MLSLILVTVALVLALAVMILFIAFDTCRVLAGVNQEAWARDGYRQWVSNLLTLLARAGRTQPWPQRLSGFTVFRFRRELRRLIRQEPPCPSQLVEWHVGFWAHVQERMSLIEHALCTQMSRVIQRLCQAVPEAQRVAYRHERETLRKKLIHLRQVNERQFGTAWCSEADSLFRMLRSLQVVFAEHGFHIHPDFARLRALEEALEPMLPQPR